jgi:hypothetical protein
MSSAGLAFATTIQGASDPIGGTAMSSSITLKGTALELLRSGLYLKLDQVDGELEPAMWDTKHTLEAHPWSIFQRMRAIGDLLDKVGWAERGAPAGVPRNNGPVQITTPEEAAIAIEALTERLEVAQDNAADPVRTDAAGILAAEQAAARVERVLTNTEAAAVAAGLLDPRKGAGDEAR